MGFDGVASLIQANRLSGLRGGLFIYFFGGGGVPRPSPKVPHPQKGNNFQEALVMRNGRRRQLKVNAGRLCTVSLFRKPAKVRHIV